MQAIAPDPKKGDAIRGSLSQCKSIDKDIQQELENILASDFFRSSKRCQTFLRYVVESACSTPQVELKERTIGITLWNRPVDYDTGTDAIVRVKANEVRRRLMNYNLSAKDGRVVIITLEPGSYVPHIVRNAVSSAAPTLAPTAPSQVAPVAVEIPPVVPAKHKFLWPTLGLALSITFLCTWAAIQVLHVGNNQQPTITRFWRPIIGQKEVMICTASPSAYRRVPFPPSKPTDSNVALRLRAEIEQLGAKPRIGKAEDITRKDLESSPYVLVGGPVMNHWNADLANHYRLGMEDIDGKGRIVDRQNPSHFWKQTKDTEGKLIEDFALITRVFRSDSGQPMISVAGISQKGSMAGGYLLTDESLLQAVNRFAPPDWDKRNMQMVIKTKLDQGNTKPPEIVSAIFW